MSLKSHDEPSTMIHESKETKRSGLVETKDDSTYTIEQMGDVAFTNHDNKGYINDVLHVSMITKTLVFLGKIVKQGMHLRSTRQVVSLRIRASLMLMQEDKVTCLPSTSLR